MNAATDDQRRWRLARAEPERVTRARLAGLLSSNDVQHATIASISVHVMRGSAMPLSDGEIASRVASHLRLTRAPIAICSAARAKFLDVSVPKLRLVAGGRS